MKKSLLLAIIALVIVVAAVYLLYTGGFTKIPSGSQYDFTRLVGSCVLGSSKYVLCCERDGSVFDCETPTAVPGDLVVVKLNLSSIANATDPYFLCMNDNLYHPANQMPDYASDSLTFRSAFQNSDSKNLSYSYDSAKDVRNVFICTKRLYPADNYQLVTYGLVPNLPAGVRSANKSGLVNLMTISKYQDSDYENIEDFISRQYDMSTETLHITLGVELR